MYFGLVSVLAAAPVHFTMGRHADLLKYFWKNKPLSFTLCFAAIIAGFISVHFFRSGQLAIYNLKQAAVEILYYFSYI